VNFNLSQSRWKVTGATERARREGTQASLEDVLTHALVPWGLCDFMGKLAVVRMSTFALYKLELSIIILLYLIIWRAQLNLRRRNSPNNRVLVVCDI
jgi:hypothetical protein